jgi:hypothetical protein
MKLCDLEALYGVGEVRARLFDTLLLLRCPPSKLLSIE